jgi:hypothetical protein
MKNFFHLLFFFLIISDSGYAQEIPTTTSSGQAFSAPEGDSFVLYEQMSDPGSNSLTSQNFEAVFDSFDSQAADDFVIITYPWTISSVEVIGDYYNGSGPAASVNIWFYNDNNGLPGSTADSVMNIVPSGGISTGLFIIPFQPYITLPAGTYWLSVQCNMDLLVGGQWGWTEQLPYFNPSVWRNPLGGFLTQCSNWGYRVTNCQVGTAPYSDLSFRLNGVALPVDLISFTATVDQNIVGLNWITATETNNQGFEVQRSADGEFEKIAFVEGHGTTTETQVYTYQDRTVGVGSYSYRLKQVDFDGTFEYSNVVEVPAAPAVFALDQNYPNPFNPSTKITFRLAVDSKVSLKVFDVLGQEVTTLVNTNLVAGAHNVNFDASSLNSGVYFYRIEATGVDGANFIDVKKMILTK